MSFRYQPRIVSGLAVAATSTQAVSDLRQCYIFSFRKQQPIRDLPSQDPVLRRQIFVSQQEFLIDCSADIGERARPKYFRASLNLTFEPGLNMLLRFQRENCEIGNQAFSMPLRFLTTGDSRWRDLVYGSRLELCCFPRPNYRPRNFVRHWTRCNYGFSDLGSIYLEGIRQRTR